MTTNDNVSNDKSSIFQRLNKKLQEVQNNIIESFDGIINKRVSKLLENYSKEKQSPIHILVDSILLRYLKSYASIAFIVSLLLFWIPYLTFSFYYKYKIQEAKEKKDHATRGVQPPPYYYLPDYSFMLFWSILCATLVAGLVAFIMNS